MGEIERIPPPASRPSDLQSVQPSHSEDDRHRFKKTLKESLKDKQEDDSENKRQQRDDSEDVIVEIDAAEVETTEDTERDDDDDQAGPPSDGHIDIKA